jgi:flotillin
MGMETLVVIGIALALVAFLFIIYGLLGTLYRKVPPNRALIVYGLHGVHIVPGGGRVVIPLLESCEELSLELMSFDVAPDQDFYTSQGVAVTVEAVAQLKVRSDPESIRTAAEQFLSKSQTEREALIRLVMEGHLRGIVGQLTVEQIVKQPEMVGEKVRQTCSEDVDKMGLEVVSFTIKQVRDENEYIANMGKPDIARIKMEADIAAAEALRDTTIRQADTARESAVARSMADQERVIAEMASQTRQAEAQRDPSLKQAEYQATTKRAQAQADKAYDIQANVQQQQVVAEEVRIERIKREEQVKVQEAEVSRREKELEATVQKAVEAERRRIETLAEAERQRLALEAAGQAEATRARGTAEADIVRVRGQAEAEIIRAKGQAEADAMAVKAAAFQHYNQAAVLDKVLGGLPELARAFAEPLSKVDKITIVSTGGGGHGTGADQLTSDMAKMIVQAPALFETLTGVKIGDLMARVPGLVDVVAAPVVTGPTDVPRNGGEPARESQ